ncbi:TPA: hypothetical protein DEP96_01655 [Candidatus Uhrbacteria bacterium]|nr:hypothetical protein [Candidatus Uhrbacteria bacterium]
MTKYIAVSRQAPGKSVVLPIERDQIITIEGIGPVTVPRANLGFWLPYFNGRPYDPYQLWPAAMIDKRILLIGLFDSEEEAWKAMLMEAHGRLARLLGVENTFEAVADEFCRRMEEELELDNFPDFPMSLYSDPAWYGSVEFYFDPIWDDFDK